MNRIVTRMILSFVVLSSAAALLPLLEGGGGAPLIPGVARGQSLVIYVGFLLGYFTLVLPEFRSQDAERDRRMTWCVLAGYHLIFAAIPLILASYISGVSAAGLLRLVLLIATAAGAPLLLLRFAPRRLGLYLVRALASLTLFAIPVLSLYLRSVDVAFPNWISSLSPWRLISRIVRDPGAVSLLPLLVITGITWLLAFVPFSKTKAGAVALASACVVFLPTSIRTDYALLQPSPKIVSQVSGVARPGLRTLLGVTGGGAGSAMTLSLGGSQHAVPIDGREHTVVVVAPKNEDRIVCQSSDGTVRELPVPYELVPDSIELALVIDPAEESEVQILASPTRKAFSIPSDRLPKDAGSLEAFDAVALGAGHFSALKSAQRDVLESFVDFGGHLILFLEERTGPEGMQPRGEGKFVRTTRSTFTAEPQGFRRTRRPIPLDSDIVRTFAPPNWQEIDLSAVIFFMAIYHIAFLLAFLLPMGLDAKKAAAVYLVSVGFVVLVVAGGGYHVLRRIFLRDNQVYTQGVTLLVTTTGTDARLISHQFLSYASMSGESCRLDFPGPLDLFVYRQNEKIPVGVRWDLNSEVSLRDVSLDRFEKKAVVRVDRSESLPLSVVMPSPERIEVLDIAGQPDALGLREARLLDGFMVDGGVLTRRFRVAGSALVDDGEAATLPIPEASQIFFRKLLGHFAPQRSRYLILRFEGLKRSDSLRDYFRVQDLGAYLIVPLP